MAKGLNKSTAQIEAKIGFQADVSQAKKAIAELQNSLQKLATQSHVGNWTKEMQEAQNAAAELAVHLKDATNVNTGKIDFSKLNQSVKQSGKTVAQYGDELLKLGPAGQQSFQQLTKAIANSEIPVRRISKSVQELGNVLKNTIRWQISSSALHSFMGAIQSAYGYAQDLNESLNKIRIVTGQNIDQMDRFADRANKAAQALSTSTLEYTRASLIYYQQGLSDEEVQARTDVTVKMANVTGNTAEKVSQQLTAVWNNYAKGAENLEYFADVMTALGAATASSSDEISQGLEKFAAIGQTVGLSYEYAAAALATVTATTRQSADVVGNAFKTLFARLEGLKLGDTLEDGTDLNKYSKALMAVGVNIKDVNGDMKDMDTILDELASKWNILGQDQQLALAQTVAGVRQYTQLIALMNNWDFMQKNVKTAKDSMGTLQKQQDIYAESWEAARDRVQAALQSIYQKLIDDDFFIKLLNALEKVIGFVDNLIDGLGGLPGLLTLIGNLALQAFGPQLQESLRNAAYSMSMLTSRGREKARAEQSSAITELSDAMRYNGTSGDQTLSSDISADLFTKQAQSMSTMVQYSDRLTKSEKALFDLSYQKLEADEKDLIVQAKQAEALAEQYTAARDQYEILQNRWKASQQLNQVEGPIYGNNAAIQEALRAYGLDSDEFWDNFNQFYDEHINEITDRAQAVKDYFNTVTEELKPTTEQVALAGTHMRELQSESDQAAKAARRGAEQIAEGYDKVNKKLEEASHKQADWAQKITTGAQALMALGNASNAVSGLFDSLADKSKNLGDKISSVIGSVSSFATSSMMAIKQVTETFGAAAGPYMWALIAAVSVATLVVKGLTAAREHELAKIKEQEAASAEYIATIQEETNKNEELAASYLKLYEAQDQTAEGKEALKSAAEKAIEAYNIENGQLLLAQGNYKQLAEEIANARREQALFLDTEGTRQLSNSAKNAIEGIKGGKISQTAQGLEFFIGNGYTSAQIAELQQQYQNVKFYQGEFNGDLYAVIEESAEGLVQSYNDLQQLVNDAARNPNLLGHEDEERIQDYLNKSKDFIEPMQEGVANLIANAVSAESEKILFANGGEINNVQEYLKIQEQILDNLKQRGLNNYSGSDVDSYLSNQGFGTLATQANVISQYSNASGISISDLLSLTAEELQGMLQVQPAIVHSIEELKQQIANYSQISGYNTGLTNSLQYKTVAGALKEGQTQAEIDKVLSENGLALSDAQRQALYRKTYEERVAWLEEMARKEEQIAVESYNKEALEKQKSEAEAAKANAEKLKETALDNLYLRKQLGTITAEEYERELAAISNTYNSQIQGYQVQVDEIDEHNQQVQTDSIFRAQQLAEVYGSILTSDVDIGDKVSADFVEKLSTIGVDISKYLVPNDDGTYSLVISGAEFREEAFNELVDKFDKLNPEEKIQIRKVLAENVTSIEQFDKLVNKTVFNTKQLSSIWEQMIRKLKAKDLDTTKLEDFADHLQEIASAANKVDRSGLAASLATDAEAAEKVAVSILNMQDGYEALSNSWDTWKKQLGPEKDKTSDEYATALANVKEAIADLINVNADQISTSFAESVFGDLDGVAKGQFEKIDDIRTKYFEDTRDKVLYNLEDETKTDLTNLFDLLQQELEQNPLEVGSALDLTSFLTGINGMEQSWVQTLTEMIAAGKISVNQLSSMFAGLGIDIVPVYGALEGPNVGQFMQAMNDAAAAAASGDYMAAMAASQVANSLVSNKQVVQTVTGWRFVKTGDTTSLTPQTPKTTGGSGSSKSKADKAVSQKTEADRYHYIREQLSDLERAYAAAGKAKDKAFGDERLRYLDQEIELTDQLIDKQDEYLAEINDYMEKAQGDRDALLASGFVTEADLDDNGLIKNWDAIWRAINKAREDAVNDYNRDKDNENIDAEGNYKAATEKIDEAERRLKQYEDTLNLWEQEQEKRVDLLRQKQELAFERTSYILDTNLKLTENDIKAINFQYDLLKDNLYKAVEAMQLLVGANYDAFNSGEMHKYLNELGYVKDNYEDLVSLWNQDIGFDTNGNVLHAISQADFIDGLQNNIDTIYDKLKEILNLDKEMFEYYSNTLAKSNEEIARYRDQMDAISSAMQHWKSILDLTSKTHKDYYKQLDAILKGQRDVAGNDYAVSKQRYEDLLEEQKHAEEALAGATGERERELLQHNLDAINEQVRDAWEKMLSDAENYAQKAKDVLVNALEMAADEAEDILTHGMGFDQLNDSMDRISSNQDEYLTKTNQLYEMNQMLRQLQQDSDKANNQAAKTRIANFTKEMEDLRDKNQLSKLDLDIAKARYEVLLAEIALEDAQNAKSVVRLQRDNEGNFGYVYTADGNDVAKAQDDLAKKQNDLYNIVLNGTNDYGQKMIQLNQQYLEKLKEINEKYTEENGFTEQERQAAILQATEEFNRLRQTYEEQYTTAMYWLNETASTDTSEAWVNAYQDIIENGQEWHDATTTYLQQVDEALDEYQSVTDVVTQEVGEDYDETKKKVDDLTEAHDQLADKLENEVLDAVQKVESAVQEATEKYAANRDRVYEMVSAYQALIREMQAYQQLAAMENFDAASDDYDSKLDYSKLMAEAFKEGNLAEVQKYSIFRDRKINELGLSDADLADKNWQTTRDIMTALNNSDMTYEQKLQWLRDHLYLPGFATGGYTGEWGSTGRLALLHEKELVLNQEDTENLLNAVSMVRGISSFIEGQARAAAGSVGFSIPGLSGGGSFEQTVTIRAEFPNVTDHNEILEAFNNLRNMATQYANRY